MEGHKTPPKEYREEGATKRSDYADPENYKYPLHSDENVRAAISYFRRYGKEYEAGKRKQVWDRIVSAAKKRSIEIADPKQELTKKSAKENKMNDVFKSIMDLDIQKGEAMDGMPNPGGDGGKEVALSPDDVAVASQMKPGDPEKAKELARQSQGSGDGDGLGGATDDESGAHHTSGSGAETSAATGAVSKGELPVDTHARHPVNFGPNAGQQYWTQGEDARVLYSNIADGRIAKAIEDGTLTPETGAPYHSPLYGVSKCRGCGTGFAKAITVCPECGMDKSTQVRAQAGLQMSKSVRDSLQPPADDDIHFD